jgi:hypothetical protein
MISANQHHDETPVAEGVAADANRTRAAASPAPASPPAEPPGEAAVRKVGLTWDISDWFRTS